MEGKGGNVNDSISEGKKKKKGKAEKEEESIIVELQQVPWTPLVIQGHTLPLLIKTKFTSTCYYIVVTGNHHQKNV